MRCDDLENWMSFYRSAGSISVFFLPLSIYHRICLLQCKKRRSRGGFRVQKKVVTNFSKIDTIYIKVIALIFVVIVVVIIIIANVAILFCFEILVVTA